MLGQPFQRIGENLWPSAGVRPVRIYRASAAGSLKVGAGALFWQNETPVFLPVVQGRRGLKEWRACHQQRRLGIGVGLPAFFGVDSGDAEQVGFLFVQGDLKKNLIHLPARPQAAERAAARPAQQAVDFFQLTGEDLLGHQKFKGFEPVQRLQGFVEDQRVLLPGIFKLLEQLQVFKIRQEQRFGIRVGAGRHLHRFVEFIENRSDALKGAGDIEHLDNADQREDGVGQHGCSRCEQCGFFLDHGAK